MPSPSTIQRVCPCGTEFMTNRTDVKNGYGRYCSRPCARRYGPSKGSDNPKWVGGRSEVQRRYRRNHPEKAHAHQTLNYSVRSGKVRKGPCEKCGARRRIHGHHHDYSKPLDVTWLCGKCHRDAHKRKEAGSAGPV